MRDTLWRNKYVARPFVSAFLFLVIPPYLFVTLNFRDAPPLARSVTFFMRWYKHNFWQARFATNPRVSSPRFICMHASLLRLVLWDSVRCTAISARSTTCIFPHYGFNFGCIKRQGSFLHSRIHVDFAKCILYWKFLCNFVTCTKRTKVLLKYKSENNFVWIIKIIRTQTGC